jgi:hypothetical protein
MFQAFLVSATVCAFSRVSVAPKTAVTDLMLGKTAGEVDPAAIRRGHKIYGRCSLIS